MSRDFEGIHNDAFDFLEKLNSGPYGRAKKILDLQNSILERAYAEASEEGGSTKLLHLITRNIRNRVESTRIGENPSFDIGKLFAYPKADDKASIAMGKVYGEMQRFENVMNMASSSPITVGDDDQYAFGADTGVKADFQYLADEEKEQKERASRRSIMRRRQKINLAKLDMSDYDLFVHEHKAEYGGAKGADEAYRKMLLKQLPPFFKDSKLSTKSLIDIGKLIKSAKGIPLVGKLMHPAGFAFAGLGMMDALLRASSASNRTVTGWSGSRMLSGSPSKQFDAMARLAGAKDEQEVLKMYGSLIGQFGSESVFASIGAALKSVPPGIARLQMAKSLGLDEKQANMLMFLTGQKPLESTKEAQETAARESRLEDMQKWGLRSGSSFTEKIRAASLMLPLEKGLEARGTSWRDIIDMANPATLPNILLRRIYNPVDAIDEGIKRQIESQDAAESYDAYESNGGPSVESNDNSSTVNMNIEKIEVIQEKAGELANGLIKAADTISGGARALLTAFGSGFMI